MIRPTRRKAWLAIAIVAALSAVPAAASAAAPASDEYVLQFPGVRQTDSGPVADANPAPATKDAGDGVQRGVVGEQETPSTPLGALGDAMTGLPVAFTVGLAALAAIVAALALSRRRPIAPAPR
jgi:hypothetical protein